MTDHGTAAVGGAPAPPANPGAPVAYSDEELLLAMRVEQLAYAAYNRSEQGRYEKDVWIEATIDLRFKGGSPIKVRELGVRIANEDPGRGPDGKKLPGRLAPGSDIDRRARVVLRSLREAVGARRRSADTAARAAGGGRTMGKRIEGDVLTIVAGDGLCGCGCGEATKGKSKYRQGHDARLRSLLYEAHRDGKSVVIEKEGEASKTVTAMSQIKKHGFPEPAAKKAPKPKAEKTEDAAEATGDSTAEGGEAAPEDAGEPEPTPEDKPAPKARVRRGRK